MEIYYDTEFKERGYGQPITLVSIGMIAEDGRTLYRVNKNCLAIDAVVTHDWLRPNVGRHLPIEIDEGKHLAWWWDEKHAEYEAVAQIEQIRADVEAFIRATPEPSLWAWYAAYDHVMYAQLFGRMIDLPQGFPMHTNDLKQEADRLGNPRMPAMQPPDTEHHALHDAVADMRRRVWLRDYARDLDSRRIQGILDRERGVWTGRPSQAEAGITLLDPTDGNQKP
jgi:hypothetical protein